VQLLVLPVAEPHAELARRVADRAADAGLRAVVDPADATVGARIRKAHDRRVPYVAVLGDREAADGTVALRLRDGRRLDGVTVARLISQLTGQVAGRSADLGFR
jgi:threonyl-tRNA synthetase